MIRSQATRKSHKIIWLMGLSDRLVCEKVRDMQLVVGLCELDVVVFKSSFV